MCVFKISQCTPCLLSEQEKEVGMALENLTFNGCFALKRCSSNFSARLRETIKAVLQYFEVLFYNESKIMVSWTPAVLPISIFLLLFQGWGLNILVGVPSSWFQQDRTNTHGTDKGSAIRWRTGPIAQVWIRKLTQLSLCDSIPVL